MKIPFSNLKDIVTDVIGLLIMLGTLYGIYVAKSIVWQWDGLIGLGVGFVFFAIPDDVIAKAIKKKFGNGNGHPPSSVS